MPNDQYVGSQYETLQYNVFYEPSDSGSPGKVEVRLGGQPEDPGYVGCIDIVIMVDFLSGKMLRVPFVGSVPIYAEIGFREFSYEGMWPIDSKQWVKVAPPPDAVLALVQEPLAAAQRKSWVVRSAFANRGKLATVAFMPGWWHLAKIGGWVLLAAISFVGTSVCVWRICRQWSRVRRGVCVGCGYPVADPLAKCPECGFVSAQ